MKVYDPGHVKNVAIVGHAGSGKTSLTEAMLFEAGLLTRLGATDEKNTASDYQEIEQERGNSIFSSLLHVEWKDAKINIIDTPGFDDFIGEVISALKVADNALMVLNAQHGVEVGTEIVGDYIEKSNKPMIIAVNHLDHEKSDFDKTIEQAKSRFGNKVTPVQYPLSQGPDYNSVLDVMNMIVYKYPTDGGKPEKQEIPEEEKEKAEKMHNDLIEQIAVNDDALMEKFFDQGTLSEEDMSGGMMDAIANREIFPAFCTAAKHNMGAGRIMSFIASSCPSAGDMPPVELEGDGEIEVKTEGNPVLFVYKTISEPHLGDMSFFKVLRGEVKIGSDLINEQTSAHERINQLFIMDGKKRVSADVLKAGDMGATVKLRDTNSNDTLHIKGDNIKVKPIEFPEAIMSSAISTVKTGEEEKLATALHHIRKEDLTFLVEHSQELKQTLLHGQGEMHLALAKWKLEHVYGVEILFENPKIPYMETIQKTAKAHYKHKKQSGGAGQFAEIYMLVEPFTEGMPPPKDLNVRKSDEIDLDWGGKLVFNNCIVGGAIDNRFMGAILKGIMEKMSDSPLTGCCVRDVRVSIYDGKMHDVDSNDMAFKTAALRAFKEGIMDADPSVLEPIYDVEVLVPDDLMGDVMSDLQTRRAVIAGMEAEGNSQKIKAKVPLAELPKYSSALRSITQGRAKYSRKFSDYAIVPPDVQQKLVEAHAAELEEASA